MNRKERIVVIGAGLSGLSAGIRLREKGVDFVVLERENEPGGLCRSRESGRFIFDCSGHLLHFRTSSGLRAADRLLKGGLTRFVRKAPRTHSRRDIPYPFQANLYALPEKTRLECVRGLQNRGRPGRDQDFASWIAAKFGPGIARHFMLPYNRKFWRFPLSRMTCGWTRSFVPVPSRGRMLSGARGRDGEFPGYNSTFWYPSAGRIDVLPRSMAENCGNILYGRRVVRIDVKRRVARTAQGEEFPYGRLISTMPMPELGVVCPGVGREEKACLRRLKWNSLLIFSLGLSGKPSSAEHWIYFPEKEFVFYRVCFPHNFSSSAAPAGQGSLYAEVSYPPGKRPGMKQLGREVLSGLRRAGIVSANTRVCAQDVLEIKYAYPVYDREYAPSRRRIISSFLSRGVVLCGRYGSWRYFSMEDAMLDGISAAERAVKDA